MEINTRTAKTLLKAIRIAKHTVTCEYSKKELIAILNGLGDEDRLSYLDSQTSIIDFIDDLEKVQRDFETVIGRNV